jgi:hypothetical protein
MTHRPDASADPLDDRLEQAAPATVPDSPEVEAELLAMIAAAQQEARPRRVRPLVRIGLGVTATVLAFGGATAAVAGGQIMDWSWWAEDPEYVLEYTLPSGAECETRVGRFAGADPAAVEAIRDYASSVDLLKVADIDGAIAEYRAGGSVITHPDGTKEDAGYGTVHYRADHEYALAVWNAVSAAITEELDRQGFPEEALGESYMGETTCPGADW